MAIVHEGCLRCPGCGEYVIEADEGEEANEDGYAGRTCGSCPAGDGDAEAIDRTLRTIVADWETVEDDFGDTMSPALCPVVITVKATSRAEAIEAASDKLQEHFGPDVEALHAKGITRDDWFNADEPFLRICALFIGAPPVDNDDGLATVIR